MTILRSGVSSTVASARPSTRYGSPAALQIKASEAYALIQFGLPKDLRKGATVLSARLRVTQSGSWAGSRILSARRTTSPWRVSTVTSTTRPTATTGVQSTAPVGIIWEFDVAADVQMWVDGTAPNYGWTIATSDTDLRHIQGFAASTGKPTLEITYAYRPGAPTSLHPSAGAVSVAKPVLQFDSDDLASLQVQVDPAANGTTPAFDSGVVVTTQPQLDLATTSYAGLASGASTQWRVRVTNSAGMTSPWSQWASFSRVAKPTVTITQPTATVWEATPPILWTSPGQIAYQVLVARAVAPATYIYNTGKVPGTATEHTPSKPTFLKDGETYIIQVRTWDAVDREATVGDPAYALASITTVLDFDPAVAGVTWVDATQKSMAPWVDLTWSRAAMPDGWSVIRDGEVLEVTDQGSDLLVSGSIYAFRDWTAVANREHVYRVAPIVNGRTSRVGPTVTITPEIKGVWLGDPESGSDVMLFGTDDPEATYGEEADTFAVIGAASTIDAVTALRGLEGSASGLLVDALDRVATADAATLLRFKEQPTLRLRIAWAAVNIPGTIRNVNPVPRRLGTNTSEVTYNASFTFKQTGELPFEADL